VASFLVSDMRDRHLPVNGNGSGTQKASGQGAFQRIVLHAFGLRRVYRDVLLLCYIQGFTIAEAAAILDISPAAATTRLDRARRQLNTRLGTEQQDRTKQRVRKAPEPLPVR
jgi:DNA-directed RNA polymerase specialized sigma24 family protein